MATPTSREDARARARVRRARGWCRRFRVAALASVAIAGLSARGARAKGKLQIVNAAHDIAHVSHVLCGMGDGGKRKCHDYAEMLTPYEDSPRALERAFAELARRFSECPTGNEGGDLGYFPRGEMSRDFERVAFDSKTPLDSVVGPVETRNGWHIMLVHHRHLADEEAKERARVKTEEMKRERLERAEKQREYQEERARRKAQREAKRHERDAHRHSLHAHADERHLHDEL